MIIDIILAIVVAYGFYIGFSRGIIKTVFTWLSVVFGLIAAIKFAPATTDFLESTFGPNAMMFIAGFLLSFVLTMVLIRMIARFLEGALETANINVINRFAGGVLLAGIFTLLFSSVVWFMDRSKLIKPETIDTSSTYEYVVEFPKTAWSLLKKLGPTVEKFWDRSLDFMEDLEKDLGEKETSTEIIDLDENGQDSSSNNQR